MTRKSRASVLIVANADKPDAMAAVPRVRKFVKERAEELLGVREISQTKHPDFRLCAARHRTRIVVLGGDGTMLAMAHHMRDEQFPMIGVNFGKLGFLTSFTVDQLMERFDEIMGYPPLRRRMLRATVWQPKAPKSKVIADEWCLNDCVINAGAPHRSILLEIKVNGQSVATITGDGLIVATATGSTAYNLSAHGPLLMPEMGGLIINPLNPHSLAYRPVVLDDGMNVDVYPVRVNEGTDVVFDGQLTVPLQLGQRINIVRSVAALIVSDPNFPPWQNIVAKFGWMAPPAK